MGELSHQYPLMNLGFFFSCFILSWSSQTICLHEDFMLPISSILCSPSLHPLVKTQQFDASLHWVASSLLPLLPPWGKTISLLSFDYVLLIIVREHHCKMYKKRVVVHYPLLYHLKYVLHNHKDQGVLSIR